MSNNDFPFTPFEAKGAEVIDLKTYKETGRLPEKEKTDFEKAIDVYVEHVNWLMSPEVKPKTDLQIHLDSIDRLTKELENRLEDFQERLDTLSSPTVGHTAKRAVWKLLKNTQKDIAALRDSIKTKKALIRGKK